MQFYQSNIDNFIKINNFTNFISKFNLEFYEYIQIKNIIKQLNFKIV